MQLLGDCVHTARVLRSPSPSQQVHSESRMLRGGRDLKDHLTPALPRAVFKSNEIKPFKEPAACSVPAPLLAGIAIVFSTKGTAEGVCYFKKKPSPGSVL